MKGIERLLETAKAVVEATERNEPMFVALLIPTLKGEIRDFEREHFPGGLTACADSPPRKKGVPSRQEMHKHLKARSLELQGKK